MLIKKQKSLLNLIDAQMFEKLFVFKRRVDKALNREHVIMSPVLVKI